MNKEKVQKIEEENRNQTKRSSQETNRIMGLAAISISILSMAAVIYQSYLAREENELMRIQQSATVLPYIDYWYSNTGLEYKFVIGNKGIGPAFIKDVKFVGFDSTSKDSLIFNSSHNFCNFLEKNSAFLDSVSVTKSSLHADMLLSPNEEKEFFTFSFNNYDQKKRFKDEYYKYFVGLNITYEDVYGARWVFNSAKGSPIKLKKK